MILKAASEEPALFLFDIFLLWIDILFRSQLCGQVEHMKFPTSKKKPFAENWNICWWNLTKERVWPFRKESIRSWWWERERKQNCSNLFVQITANHSIIVIIAFVLSITNQSWRFNHHQLTTFVFNPSSSSSSIFESLNSMSTWQKDIGLPKTKIKPIQYLQHHYSPQCSKFNYSQTKHVSHFWRANDQSQFQRIKTNRKSSRGKTFLVPANFYHHMFISAQAKYAIDKNYFFGEYFSETYEGVKIALEIVGVLLRS